MEAQHYDKKIPNDIQRIRTKNNRIILENVS